MTLRKLLLSFSALVLFSAALGAQSWQQVNNHATFNASVALLQTDGTVLVHKYNSTNWWKLTPDINGSYLNGTWSQIGSMPAGYTPLYYGSSVLADGRILVEGGEYLNLSAVWTNKGALYNPTTNKWTNINPPTGWANIGDAQQVVLSNGTLVQANALTSQQATFNASTFTWTAVGSGKADGNDEEGYALLPSGKVLTIDANNTSNLTNSEIMDPTTFAWTSAGSTIVKLPDLTSNGGGSHEIGPMILRPDGTVFATGATANTAIYNTSTGVWSVGPTFPNSGGQLDAADAPACLLPSGNVLVTLSPGIFGTNTKFYEYDGTGFIAEPVTTNSPSKSSYEFRMVLLPTGQVLATDGTTDVEIYTPTGSASSAWQPTITQVPTTLTHGKTFQLKGTQLNGLSQGCAYGDDAQSATNYPLVRITNTATGHVFYAKTHNHSSMGVATGSLAVTTKFDVPAGIELGAATLQVVANGIASASKNVTIN